MLERENHSSQETGCLAILGTLLDSLKIFLTNFRLFFSIFALTILPLSLLLFSLSLSSHPIRTQIYHLESLALVAQTRFEARHLWKESRAEAVSLIHLRALYFLPCYALSLLAAVTIVASTEDSRSGKRPSVDTAVKAVKLSWKKPLGTSVCVYAIMLAYVHIQRMLTGLLRPAALRLLAAALGSTLEVYVVAVMSLGLVVSIVEDRVGWNAIRVGSDLMEGRRFSGWVLSGLCLLISTMISWGLDEYMEGQDLSRVGWRVVMKRLGDNAGLVCLFGLVVLWSYTVTTVLYCECRRRHVIREESGDIV